MLQLGLLAGQPENAYGPVGADHTPRLVSLPEKITFVALSPRGKRQLRRDSQLADEIRDHRGQDGLVWLPNRVVVNVVVIGRIPDHCRYG